MEYRHPLTPQKEYPLTAREIIHASSEILAETYPQQTIRGVDLHLPAYEWSGAGSERGGCSEIIQFDTFVVVPPSVSSSNRSTLISVGKRSSRNSFNQILLEGDAFSFHPEQNIYSSRGYSVLLRMEIPPERAAEIISGSSNRRSVESLLLPGVHNFNAVPLLAYDQPRDRADKCNSRFLSKSNGGMEQLADNLSAVASSEWNFLFSGSQENRHTIAQFLAAFSCDGGKESPLMTPYLALAQHNIYRHLNANYTFRG